MRVGSGGALIALGWALQRAVGGPTGSRAWPLFALYALAIFLFAILFDRGPLARFATEPLPQTPPSGPLRQPIGRPAQVLLCLAVASLLLSVTQFASPATYPIAWKLHAAAVLLFITAFLPVSRSASGRLLEVTLRQLLPVAALLALAVFARVWQLEWFPFGTWYDEASNGIDAVQVLQDGSYRPVYVSSTQMPAHFQYLLALSFLLLGPSTTAIRLVTAAFGIATVLFAYLLFRRWFGPRGGLVAALLLAVMRYHLTISRFGMQAVTTPAFELALLYLLDRALARRAPRDFAWIGLTLGFGLAFYFAFRLFPIALLLFAAGRAVSAFRSRRRRTPAATAAAAAADRETDARSLAALRPHLAVGVLGFVIATAPIVQFAAQYPEIFFERTSTVSIFRGRDEPNLAKALLKNTARHLLMFNFEGDNNGRHNLPGQPMLDPLSATLFVFGLGLAIRRWQDPTNLLMLLLLFIMTLGGILSLDYEAPQSLRSIGVIPALVYFVTLPLVAMGAGLERGEGDRHRAAAGLYAAALGVVIVAVAYLNLDVFFNQQRVATNVWLEYSTVETLAAREMKRLAPTHGLIISSFFDGHPTVRFLAPAITTYRRWTLADRLPLIDAGARGVALVLDSSLRATYNTARRYYPGAVRHTFRPPLGGDPVLYVLEISPQDLHAVQGAVARYFADPTFRGSALGEVPLPRVAADWTATPPIAAAVAAELYSTLAISEYGPYRFEVRGAPAAALSLDGSPVGAEPVVLAIGNHALRLRVPVESTTVDLWWQRPGVPQLQPVPPAVLFRPPVTPTGLRGSYFPSPDWTGPPAFVRVDPEIAFYFQDLPLLRPYTVEWAGKIFVPEAGRYRLGTDSIDDSTLSVDQQMVVSNTTRTAAEAEVELERGWHDLILRFADRTSHTQVFLYWVPPNGNRETIPSIYLSPPMGDGYPDVPEVAAGASADTGAVPFPARPPAPPAVGPTKAVSPLTLVHLRTIGGPGSAPARFNQPRALAVTGGRVFVVDTGNQRVQILDAEGNFITALRGGEQAFSEPFDLTVAANGDVVVLDSQQGWLYRFDQNGNALGRVGGPEAQLYAPRGVSAGPADTLYIADTGGGRVVKMSAGGEVLQVIGTEGSARERLAQPSDVALDADGHLFVVDVETSRIVRFGSDAAPMSDFRIPDATSTEAPRLALLAPGSLLVTAPAQHRIQHYADDGRLLGEWGALGDGPGQLQLPTGIVVHGDVLWVADTGNHRIQQWAIQR